MKNIAESVRSVKRHSKADGLSPLQKIRRDWKGYLFALPYVVLFVIFTVIPVVVAMLFSFTQFNMLQAPKILWFDNYIDLFFNDAVFLIALKNTLIFAAITGPIGYILCYFFAWCINELAPAVRAFVTLCFYAPSISGNAFLIWTLMFNGDSYGYVNGMLLNLGVISEPILFFSNPDYMVGLVIVVILWMSLGTSFLSFVAGFQGLDRSLYEAAAVDGLRDRWQELWYITLPQMKPQLTFGAIMSITGSFGVGDVITGLVGYPSNKYLAHTLMHHLQDYGNMRFEMGYASAIAVVLFVLMIGTNLIVQKLLSRVGD